MKALAISMLGLLAVPMVQAAVQTNLPKDVESAFAAYTALPSTLVPILQKAQDKDSATAAAEELKKALPSIYNVRQKLHDMPRLTPAQSQQVSTLYGQRMREEWAEMYVEIVRLRNNRCFHSEELRNTFRLMCMMIEK